MTAAIAPPPLVGPILTLISHLDSYGAPDWNLRHVALVSTAALAVVHVAGRDKDGKKRGGVCWEGLVHAVASGAASAACIYLNFFAAEYMSGETGVSEDSTAEL